MWISDDEIPVLSVDRAEDIVLISVKLKRASMGMIISRCLMVRIVC